MQQVLHASATARASTSSPNPTPSPASTAALAGNLRSLSSCHQQDRFASTLSQSRSLPFPHRVPDLAQTLTSSGRTYLAVLTWPSTDLSVFINYASCMCCMWLASLCLLLHAAFATFTASGSDIGICSYCRRCCSCIVTVPGQLKPWHTLTAPG